MSRAVVHLELARPDASPEIEVVLTLVGGEDEHVATLERVFLGTQFDVMTELDLAFPTRTVRMEPRTLAPIALVPGTMRRADFIDHCQSTLPIGAVLAFEDTANLIATSPTGQLAVFCE